MTEKHKFQYFLKRKGFRVTPVLSQFDIMPNYRKDKNKNRNLISNISCCIFQGKDTEKGLGCVTFYYGGIQRDYRTKNKYRAEILKKAVVCKTAKEAIREYEDWIEKSAEELEAMEIIF